MSICLVALVATSACQPTAGEPFRDPSGPDSMTALCSALGLDPATNSQCTTYGSEGDLRDLLESVFPLGTASRSDVSSRLGPYLLEQHIRADGTPRDVYAILQTFVPAWPTRADFAFDESDTLVSILIVD